jgi:hypothetical protein
VLELAPLLQLNWAVRGHCSHSRTSFCKLLDSIVSRRKCYDLWINSQIYIYLCCVNINNIGPWWFNHRHRIYNEKICHIRIFGKICISKTFKLSSGRTGSVICDCAVEQHYFKKQSYKTMQLSWSSWCKPSLGYLFQHLEKENLQCVRQPHSLPWSS